MGWGGGTKVGIQYLLLDPATKGSIPSIPKICSEEKNVDVVEVIQRRCLEESALKC